MSSRTLEIRGFRPAGRCAPDRTEAEVRRLIRLLSPAEIALMFLADRDFTLPADVPDRHAKMIAARSINQAVLREQLPFIDERVPPVRLDSCEAA